MRTVQFLRERRLGDVESGQFGIERVDVEIVEVDASSGGSSLGAHLLRLAHEAEHVTQHRTLHFLCKTE